MTNYRRSPFVYLYQSRRTSGCSLCPGGGTFVLLSRATRINLKFFLRLLEAEKGKKTRCMILRLWPLTKAPTCRWKRLDSFALLVLFSLCNSLLRSTLFFYRLDSTFRGSSFQRDHVWWFPFTLVIRYEKTALWTINVGQQMLNLLLLDLRDEQQLVPGFFIVLLVFRRKTYRCDEDVTFARGYGRNVWINGVDYSLIYSRKGGELFLVLRARFPKERCFFARKSAINRSHGYRGRQYGKAGSKARHIRRSKLEGVSNWSGEGYSTRKKGVEKTRNRGMNKWNEMSQFSTNECGTKKERERERDCLSLHPFRFHPDHFYSRLDCLFA